MKKYSFKSFSKFNFIYEYYKNIFSRSPMDCLVLPLEDQCSIELHML